MAEEADPLLDPEAPRLGGKVLLLGTASGDLQPPVDVRAQPGEGLEEQVWPLPGLEATDIQEPQWPLPPVRVRAGVRQGAGRLRRHQDTLGARAFSDDMAADMTAVRQDSVGSPVEMAHQRPCEAMESVRRVLPQARPQDERLSSDPGE